MHKGVTAVSLRGKKAEEERSPMMSFRCPPEFRRYIDETAKRYEKDKTEVLTDALALDRDLAERLKDERSRLETFAKNEGLRMDADLPEILARLVLDGLAKRRL